MKRAIIRWVLWPLATLITLAILAAASVAFVMNTERGTRWALEQAAQAVPGELAVGEFEGTLWRGLTFADLRYRGDGQAIAAADLELQVNWPASALGYVQLRHVNAAHLVIELAESDEAPVTSLAVPPAPVTVAVTTSSIGELRVSTGAQETALQDIELRKLRYEQSTVSLRSLALVLEGLALRSSDVSLTLSGDGPLRADVDWQRLESDWSGNGSLRGSLRAVEFVQSIAGPLPAAASGRVQLLGRSEPHFDVSLRWRTWTFDTFDLVNGSLSVAGLIDNYTVSAASADLVSDGRRVRLTASGQGDRQGLDTLAATATYEEFIAALQGNLAWLPDIASDFEGRVQAGANRIDVQGTLRGRDLDVAATLDIRQLGDTLPGYSGQVSGSATVVSAAGGTQVRFALLGTQLGAEALGQVAIDSELIGLVEVVEGGVAAMLERGSVALPAAGEWRLANGLNARWAAGALELEPHRWVGDFGELQVAALTASAETMTVEARLVDVPLDVAEAWLPGNYRVTGVANAAVDLRRNDDDWSGNLSWRQDGTAITVTDIDDVAVTIQIPEAMAEATLAGGRAEGRASLSVEPGLQATLDIEFADIATPESMQAELRISGEDFAWVPALVPTIDNVGGTVTAEITAEGSPSNPTLRGRAEWRDGQLLVPAMNAPLDDIEVIVEGGSSGSLRLEGTAAAGDGTLALSGQATDILQPGRALTLSITGQEAQLVDWPEYRVWATPDLRISGRGAAWQFGGDIRVPQAELAFRDRPESAVTVSTDVVVAGEEPPEPTGLRWTGDANIYLGDEVRFSALGLSTRLAGELLVRAPPNRPVQLSGTVSLEEGTFAAFGQQLAIREGTLTFTGPVDDPLVDVTAVRVIDTIDGTVTAGIHVRGRAQNLTTTVFAEPAMADADALSYLVIGRPLNEATEAQGGDLSGAALSLGLKQATRLTQQIGQTVGLDQLAITGDGGDSTALVAGKQVNSRVYARYSYGVFSRVGALMLRYRLTDRLTLEAGVGETQSIDILYTVERD